MQGHRNEKRQRKLIGFGAIFLVSAIFTASVISFNGTYLSLGTQESAQKCASVDDPSDPMSHFYTAYQESYGILNDITNQSWTLMKERVRNRQNHLHPEQPWTASIEANQWYQDNVSPLSFLHPPPPLHFPHLSYYLNMGSI
jgi:hypothetical protein